MRAACISGWGQPEDSLRGIAPEDAEHIAYAHLASEQEAIAHIAAVADECELVIAWSLGGQLALRAIATGLLRPKKLVLIASPFQFARAKEGGIGMPPDTFAQFRQNYEQNPFATLNRAWALIAKDDANGEAVRHHLAQTDKEAVIAQNWLMWLDVLGRFSCESLYLDNAPPTLILHGKNDAVVYPAQAAALEKILPRVRVEMLPSCGHAPHWHDETGIRARIEAFAHD